MIRPVRKGRGVGVKHLEDLADRFLGYRQRHAFDPNKRLLSWPSVT